MRETPESSKNVQSIGIEEIKKPSEKNISQAPQQRYQSSYQSTMPIYSPLKLKMLC